MMYVVAFLVMLVTEGKLLLSSELANCLCLSNTIAGKWAVLEYWIKVSKNSACLFILYLYNCISKTHGLCSPRQQLPMYFGTTLLILGYYSFTGERLLVFLQMTDESFISWAWLNGASLSKSWEDCKRIILSWVSFSLKYLVVNFISIAAVLGHNYHIHLIFKISAEQISKFKLFLKKAE